MRTDNSDVVLDAVLGDHILGKKIKSGEVGVPHVRLAWHDYQPTNNAFPVMVNELKFDMCEMAIMTFLLAHRFNRPIGLLPVTVSSRFQHPYLVYKTGGSVQRPEDLAGGTIAVRSYTVTTGAWIRAILEQQYGVDPSSVRWLGFEPPHVAAFVNPDNVEMSQTKEPIIDLVASGRVDAGVIGGDMELPEGVERVFPDGSELEWYDQHGVVPINHMVTVTDELSEAHPDVVRNLTEAFVKAKQGVPPREGVPFDPFPVGIDAVRGSLELMMEYGVSQKILDKAVPVEELFAAPVRDWL